MHENAEKKFLSLLSEKILPEWINKKKQIEGLEIRLIEINKVDIDETNEMTMTEFSLIDENKNNGNQIDRIHNEDRIDTELFSNIVDVHWSTNSFRLSIKINENLARWMSTEFDTTDNVDHCLERVLFPNCRCSTTKKKTIEQNYSILLTNFRHLIKQSKQNTWSQLFCNPNGFSRWRIFSKQIEHLKRSSFSIGILFQRWTTKSNDERTLQRAFLSKENISFCLFIID